MLHMLGALALFRIDLLRILRVLGSITRFGAVDTSRLAAFRGLLLSILPVLQAGLTLWLLLSLIHI